MLPWGGKESLVPNFGGPVVPSGDLLQSHPPPPPPGHCTPDSLITGPRGSPARSPTRPKVRVGQKPRPGPQPAPEEAKAAEPCVWGLGASPSPAEVKCTVLPHYRSGLLKLPTGQLYRRVCIASLELPVGRKVSETRPLLSHERSTKQQIRPTELEPRTGGLEAHGLATVTLETNTAVSCAADVRLNQPGRVPGRTLGGPWGRVDPRPEMADTDRKASLEHARGLSSRRDDCATFDLTAASSARPRPQSSPLQTPAPSPLPTGRKKDCTSRSPPPRSCRQLRRRGRGERGGVGWDGERRSSHPGTPELHLRASGPAPGSRLAAPRTLLACGRRASLRFLTSSVIAVPGLGCLHNPPGEGEENCNELRGAVSVPGSLATRRCAFPGVQPPSGA